MPVILYCGNNEYVINTELAKLRKSVLQDGFSDLNRKIITEKGNKQISLRDVIELIETTPMMFGNLLVEIHSTSMFTRGKTEDEKNLNRLIANLKDVQPQTYVVFVCIFPKDEDKKIDSAKKLVKTIKEIGEIREYNAFKFYETDKIVEWVLKQAKTKKLILSKENATLIQSLVGTDLRTLDSELEKIKTYILPSTEITKEDILNLSQTNEDAFSVLNLWLKNDKLNLLIELNKLLQREFPQKIIAVFQSTLKRWLRIKLESEYSNAQEIAKTIGAHPFFIQNELARLKGISKERLLALRKNLNKAEFQMKSGELKPNLALEKALVQ